MDLRQRGADGGGESVGLGLGAVWRRNGPARVEPAPGSEADPRGKLRGAGGLVETFSWLW